MKFLAQRVVFVLILLCSLQARAVDLGALEKALGTTGVEGWVHGAVSDRGVFVFTYRNPSDFFDYVEMSLVTDNPDIRKQLDGLTRHDKIRAKGSFLDNPSPQKHIQISQIELLKPYQSGYPVQPYDHQARIPDDLRGKTSATFLVHAVGGDGAILVVEYEDAVIPVFVKNPALTRDLYRGDVVQLAFKLQGYPDEPAHLNLDLTDPQPVKVLESIKAKHGQKATLTGTLILFPKSPEIIFNVFAVQEKLQAGLERQYTLVNFTDPAVFAKIRDKLQKAWDSVPNGYTAGRNRLLSTKIRVKATGTLNEVDPSQANPQILLDSPDSIEILSR